MLPRVLVHHHFTVLQTLAIGRFQKTVDTSEPDLVLGINGSIANLVTVFPFNTHAMEFSSGGALELQQPEDDPGGATPKPFSIHRRWVNRTNAELTVQQ
jgi:hypothetical protein